LKFRLKGGLITKMDNNKQGPFSWLKKVLKTEGTSDKKTGKYQYMLVVLCIGAAFMIVGNVVFKKTPTTADVPVSTSEKVEAADVPAFGLNKGSSNKAVTAYEEKYESQLKKALQQMLGVNDVTVVVNIDSTDKKVLEKNRVSKSQTT
jgi:stage III sporulation protein AG